MMSVLDRDSPYFAVDFCQSFFNFPDEVVISMDKRGGGGILYYLWKQFGDEIYESPLYLLREEIYRSSHPIEILPEFIKSLDINSALLDYGCGTGEAVRRDWVDKGRRTDFYDISRLARDYRKFKFYAKDNAYEVIDLDLRLAGPYDAVVCTDVLEHIEKPLDVTNYIFELMKPKASALFLFNREPTIAGHLIESIDQYEDWRCMIERIFDIVYTKDDVYWVRKP